MENSPKPAISDVRLRTCIGWGKTVESPSRLLPATVCRTIAHTSTLAGTNLQAALIDKLLRLAALRLETQERALLHGQLEKIVHLIDAMQAAETAGVEPLDHPLEGVQPLRSDDITEIVDRDRFQRTAPEVRDGLYLVPRVVE